MTPSKQASKQASKHQAIKSIQFKSRTPLLLNSVNIRRSDLMRSVSYVVISRLPQVSISRSLQVLAWSAESRPDGAAREKTMKIVHEKMLSVWSEHVFRAESGPLDRPQPGFRVARTI